MKIEIKLSAEETERYQSGTGDGAALADAIDHVAKMAARHLGCEVAIFGRGRRGEEIPLDVKEVP